MEKVIGFKATWSQKNTIAKTYIYDRLIFAQEMSAETGS
jgi:hypothetical protein